MNGQNRNDITVGAHVKIVLKADQRTGKLTEGVVARLLTKSSFHPHGIKVMLEDGQVGRVQEVIDSSLRSE
ncbi:MAG: YwbE family protein [Clostridiales bacterium]|nr:YwbE family protein [Clostridiales bacterium]